VAIILSIVLLILFFTSIYFLKFFRLKEVNRHWISVAFATKILVATLLIGFYSQKDRNKSDIFRFFDDAQIINSTFKENPNLYLKIITGIGNYHEEFEPYKAKTNNWDSPHNSLLASNNRLIIRYISVTSLLFFGYYVPVALLTVYLSFLGLFAIYRLFNLHFTSMAKPLFLLFFLLPSLLFWTSGLLKEALLIALIGGFTHAMYSLFNRQKWLLNLIIALVFFLLIAKLRALVAGMILFAGLPFLINSIFSLKRQLTTYIIMLFVAMTIFVESDKIMNQSVSEIFSQRRQAYIEQALADKSGSLMSEKPLPQNYTETLKQIPASFFQTLFRPFPHEISNLFAWLMFGENLLLIAIPLILMFRYRFNPTSGNLIFMLLLFSITYLIITGLTVPIYGAIARYRSIPLLFLFLSLIISFQPKSIPTTPSKT